MPTVQTSNKAFNNTSIINIITMTENISITLTDRVYQKLEEKRGKIPRATYINSALEDYFRLNKESKTKK